MGLDPWVQLQEERDRFDREMRVVSRAFNKKVAIVVAFAIAIYIVPVAIAFHEFGLFGVVFGFQAGALTCLFIGDNVIGWVWNRWDSDPIRLINAMRAI